MKYLVFLFGFAFKSAAADLMPGGWFHWAL